MADSYKYLRFFNKTGDYFNFQYDESKDKWIGRIDFFTIAEGLAEVQNLYVLEEVFNTSENRIDFVTPVKKSSVSSPSMTYRFIDIPRIEDIFLFDPSNEDLSKSYSSHFNFTEIPYTLDQNGKKLVSESILGDYQLNLGFIPSDENRFEAKLIGEDSDGHVFLDLTLYGEGEEEDERLRDILVSLGFDIIPREDSIIFDKGDVNEINPDWRLINRKRKELLIEHHNIFPYMGSYKALINILKYYGYQNVRMKEYWKNVDLTSVNFGKYRQTDIIDLFSEKPDPMISNLIPSKIYKKTNLFGLFYDINVITENFDEDGIPITEEVYQFSPEEVLIKLFALKRKLIKYWLPLNSKIVDIVGEAIYFANYRLNIVTTQNRIDSISLGIKPEYEIFPNKIGMIQDLRALQWLGGPVGPDIGASGTSNYLLWIGHLGLTGATITPTTANLTLYLKLGGMTSGRVTLYRDGLRNNFVYSPEEIRDLLVDSYNNATYIPGFNDEEDIEFLKTRTYAYADDTIQKNGIRIVENTPQSFPIGSTFLLTVEPTPNMLISDAPSPFAVSSIDSSVIPNPLTYYLGAYVGYFNDTKVPISLLNDAPNIPVGYPIILKNRSFDITWESARVTFNQVDEKGLPIYVSKYSHFLNSFQNLTWGPTSIPNYILTGDGFPGATHPSGATYMPIYEKDGRYTWETVGYLGHTEMQWIVKKEEDETPSFFFDSGQRSIIEINEIPLTLPYVGKYTVQLKIWDSFNMQSIIIDEDVIEVHAPEADFIGWYATRELNYTMDTPKYPVQTDYNFPQPSIGSSQFLTWNDYNSTWDLPFHPNESIEMLDISSNALDSVEFYQTIENPIDDPLVDRFGYNWNLIGESSTWNDAYHLWWDNIGTRIYEFKLLDISVGPTTGYLAMIEGPSTLDLKRGWFYTENSSGWEGPTAPLNLFPSATQPGQLVYVAPLKRVFIRGTSISDGFCLSSDSYTMDAISFEISNSNMRERTLDLIKILNELNEKTHPILSKFIFYYNESYGNSTTINEEENPYALFPFIFAVSKEFQRNFKFQIDSKNITVDKEWAYPTINFGYLGDIPTHFEISKIPNSGGKFKVEYLEGGIRGYDSYTYEIPAGITTLRSLCNELNGSTAQSLPVIGDFVFNIVLGASGWSGGNGPNTLSDVKIQGVLKHFTNNQRIKITFDGGVIGTSYGRSIIKNPTWDSVRIHKYSQNFPLLTTLNFTCENSKMKGKTNILWKLQKEGDLNFPDIYYNNQYFSYMFNQRGSYSISVTITDSNGNKKTIKKSEIIKII